MAKRRTKLELENELARLRQRVEALEAENARLRPVPGEFSHCRDKYVARMPLSDYAAQLELERRARDIVCDCDTHPREPKCVLLLDRYHDQLYPGVDAIVAKIVYHDEDGFSVHQVWPAVKVQ